MKRGRQDKERQALSAKGLLKAVKKSFSKSDPQENNPRGRPRQMFKADSLMSALGMFSLKSPSLLAFD